jgi:hypothetical protein
MPPDPLKRSMSPEIPRTMSRQMVERYMRFRDQMQIAMAGLAKLKPVPSQASDGLDREQIVA